jgi:tetrahydromethanopterin S-methyltransferase subunit C
MVTKLSLVDKMGLKDEAVLSIGMMSLAIGILVGRFTSFEYSGFSISAFVAGVLTGLSLVMNLFYLARRSRK